MTNLKKLQLDALNNTLDYVITKIDDLQLDFKFDKIEENEYNKELENFLRSALSIVEAKKDII